MTTPFARLCHRALAGGVIFLALLPWSLANGTRTVSEKMAADPQGMIEIFCLAGSVEINAWDRAEVEVTGKVDDNVDHVELTSSDGRTSVRVIMRGESSHMGAEANLVIRVPAKSFVYAMVVSASVKIHGVQGDAKLQTISGDVSGDVAGNLRVNGVSGAVRIKAPQAHMIEIKTISGDIELTGGDGEVEVSSVSGTSKINVGTLTRGRFKSVSGSMTAELALAPDARLDGESVSGAITFNFPVPPGAEFDVQSFSGMIDNCFGPKPAQPRYGPGSRLAFKSGDGRGQVHIDTQSGSVHLCASKIHESAATDGGVKVAPVNNVQACPTHDPFYVI